MLTVPLHFLNVDIYSNYEQGIQNNFLVGITYKKYFNLIYVTTLHVCKFFTFNLNFFFKLSNEI